MLKVNNVTKIYKDGTIGIEEASILLPDTGLVTIEGKSGSGKTTLLNIISGIITPSKGNILYNGVDISKIRNYTLNNISYVYQDYNLFIDLDVESNVNFFDRDDSTLDLFGIKELSNKRIDEISGGEARRVSIARAYNKKSKILICDEPTESLDKDNSKIIIDILKRISKDILVIVVSHESDMIKPVSDLIIKIDNSEIADIKENKNLNSNKAECYINNIFNLKRSIFKYTFNRMKKNFLLELLNLFVLLLSLTIFIISFFILNLDFNRIEVDNLLNNNKTRISISDEDAYSDIYLKDKYSNIQFAYTYSNLIFTSAETNKNIFYKYFYDLPGIVKIDDNTFISNDRIYGKLPNNKNEVLVTEYLYECIKDMGILILDNTYYPASMNDLIGKTIQFGNTFVKITGILKQDIEDYYVLKEKENISGRYLEVKTTTFEHDIIDYNNIYINEELFNELDSNDLSLKNIFINSSNSEELISVKKGFKETSSAYSVITEEFENMIDYIDIVFVILIVIVFIIDAIFITYYINNSLHNKIKEINSMAYLGIKKGSIVSSYLIELSMIIIISIILPIVGMILCKGNINYLLKEYFILDIDYIKLNSMIYFKIGVLFIMLLFIIYISLYKKINKIYKNIQES